MVNHIKTARYEGITGEDFANVEELMATPIVQIDDLHKIVTKELTGFAANLASLNMNTAANTAAIAALNATLQRLHESDKEKWTLATGKGYVPLGTFGWVVLTLCIVIVALALNISGVRVKTPWGEMENQQRVIKELERRVDTNTENIERKPMQIQEPVRVQIDDKDDPKPAK